MSKASLGLPAFVVCRLHGQQFRLLYSDAHSEGTPDRALIICATLEHAEYRRRKSVPDGVILTFTSPGPLASLLEDVIEHMGLRYVEPDPGPPNSREGSCLINVEEYVAWLRNEETQGWQ